MNPTGPSVFQSTKLSPRILHVTPGENAAGQESMRPLSHDGGDRYNAPHLTNTPAKGYLWNVFAVGRDTFLPSFTQKMKPIIRECRKKLGIMNSFHGAFLLLFLSGHLIQ